MSAQPWECQKETIHPYNENIENITEPKQPLITINIILCLYILPSLDIIMVEAERFFSFAFFRDVFFVSRVFVVHFAQCTLFSGFTYFYWRWQFIRICLEIPHSTAARISGVYAVVYLWVWKSNDKIAINSPNAILKNSMRSICNIGYISTRTKLDLIVKICFRYCAALCTKSECTACREIFFSITIDFIKSQGYGESASTA